MKEMRKLCLAMQLCFIWLLLCIRLSGNAQKVSETGQQQILITKEQAIEIALRKVPIPPNYRFSSCHLGTTYILDETAWVVWYEPVDEKKAKKTLNPFSPYVRIDIDPQTGDVICFDRVGLASTNASVRLTPEQAIERAKEFLTPWIEQYTTWENLQLSGKPFLRDIDKHFRRDDKKKTGIRWYEISFGRIVDGYLWPVNGWMVHVDAFSGEILFYHQRWNREKVWVDDRNMIPKEKAIEIVSEEIKRRKLKLHLTGEVSIHTIGFGEKQPDGSLRIPLIYVVHYDMEVPEHLREEFRKRYGRPFWPGGCKVDPYTGQFVDRPPRDFRDLMGQ